MTFRDRIPVPGDVKSRDRRPTGVGLEEGRQDPDGSRLAGAVRSQQPDDRPLWDVEVEPVEGADLALAGFVDLDQAFGRDGVVGHPDLAAVLGSAEIVQVAGTAGAGTTVEARPT